MTFFRLEPISVSVPAPATASDSWLSSWWSSLWLPSISGAEREGEVKDPEKEEGHSFYRGLDKADIFIFSHEGSPALANSPFFTAATDENPTKFQDKKRVVLVLSKTDDKSVEAFIDEVRNITDLEDRKKLQLIFPDSFLESEDKKNKLYQKIFTLDFPVKFDFMSDYIDPSSTIKYDFLPNLDQKIGRDVLREDGDYLEYFLRKIEYIESSAVIEGKKEGLKETLVGEIKESGSDVKYSFLLSGGNLKSQEGRDDKYWKDVINRLDVENNISSRRSEIKRISNNALKEATLGEGDKPLLNFMQNRTQGYGLQMNVTADTSKEGILSFTIKEVNNGAGKYAGFKEGDKIEFKIANSKSLHSQAIIISQLRSGNLTGAKIYKKNQENQLEPINHRDQRLIQEKIFFAYDEKIAQPLITENLSHEQYESCTESLSKIINLQQTLSVAIHHLADAKKRGGTELQAGLQADIDRLEADLKEQRGVAASLGAEKEEAEEKMQKLTAELEEAKKGLKDLKVIRGKLMKTRENIAGVTQKVQDATKLLREEQAKSEEAKRQVSELQVELAAAEKDRNDAAEQLNKLIGEFATVSEQMSLALSIASGSRSKEVTKDTSLAASKERFQQSIEKINKVSKEYAESKDELTCDIEKKNEEIAQLQNKLTRDTEEKNQKIAQLKDELTRDTEEKNQEI
ncbi:hypothetical protein N8772_03330, partial [Rickettsiales bacterium]|nr:hypothetical protein [Rickettsiales bacterium]